MESKIPNVVGWKYICVRLLCNRDRLGMLPSSINKQNCNNEYYLKEIIRDVIKVIFVYIIF
jgi:hypothetical protein